MSKGTLRNLSSSWQIFISTGEVSGDLQGALLIDALYRKANAVGVKLEIVALGGPKMAAAGATIIGDTSSIGSMGLLEALPHIWPTLQIQRRAQQYLRSHPPDVIVPIDYIGPNMNICTYVKQHLPQVPIVYYIAPQMWVWTPSDRDVKRMVNVIDKLLAIFPEEARYFQKQGAQVKWVGHPLLDRLQEFPKREQARASLGIAASEIAIALLPCSRQQEVKYLLPVIFEAAKQLQEKLPQVHYWIPLSLEKLRLPLEKALAQYSLQATLVSEKTPEVLAAADLALAKSGTVNLELALLNVPQVVVYRVHPFTWWIARNFFNFSIPFMSPPNLVQMQPVVPEFLQEQATAANIVRSVLEILYNNKVRQQMLTDYQQVRQSLGETGACERAAWEIIQIIAEKRNFKL
ncbi:MAG: lipid-A-disaccharide synthase [Oscillatoriaceae bacterium SKW80]|nr:lipid-A-disaccharide synthase [Oscillatoriaceae bacterium SKYG93]MCX8120551.1 lipid-A-disaccharide synthase [Oscillatoriaceae bacterium SKW80]MDW8452789.1 lipid-A-disaccharide synthase [Oscillatoriaceae cyanobacterium SKYGB_i_bin93]HIK27141.1 lipid-A-disaccharide synthase [Oscillatoriaceae cyanobacterium M7585_C2015_266]